MIILYRMHTKKTYPPPKAAAIRLTLLLFPMCTKPRARYQNSEPPNQRNRSRFASRSNCTHLKEIFPFQYHIYILIIHPGPAARTVKIKNHGQDSPTSQLEPIRFKYLGLRTCPECKNRYAKHTSIKALLHGAIFLQLATQFYSW